MGSASSTRAAPSNYASADQPVESPVPRARAPGLLLRRATQQVMGPSATDEPGWGALKKLVDTEVLVSSHPEGKCTPHTPLDILSTSITLPPELITMHADGGKVLPGFSFANGASSRAIAEVDLGAISQNVCEIQKRASCSGCKLMGGLARVDPCERHPHEAASARGGQAPQVVTCVRRHHQGRRLRARRGGGGAHAHVRLPRPCWARPRAQGE